MIVAGVEVGAAPDEHRDAERIEEFLPTHR